MGLKIEHANAVDKIVGANLRALRIARGLSQTALGEAVNISFQQIQKYEHGTNRVGASRLWQFCLVFNVGVSRFFEGLETGSPEPQSHYPEQRLAFLVHPQGHQLAEAFLKLKDSQTERAVIDLCKALAAKSTH